MAKVSVVMTAYILDNELLDLTQYAIEGYRNLNGDTELILAENNGDYLAPGALTSEADIHIYNSVNGGNGLLWDQGMKVANGDYILLCDIVFFFGNSLDQSAFVQQIKK